MLYVHSVLSEICFLVSLTFKEYYNTVVSKVKDILKSVGLHKLNKIR